MFIERDTQEEGEEEAKVSQTEGKETKKKKFIEIDFISLSATEWDLKSSTLEKIKPLQMKSRRRKRDANQSFGLRRLVYGRR